MDEYISRETMRGIIREQEAKHGLMGCAWIEMAMDRQTAADVVPVVRCKDCLWYENLTLICHLRSQFYDGGRYWDMFRPDDFCSYAEPKEGAENETD